MHQTKNGKTWKNFLFALLNLAVVGMIFFHEFGGKASPMDIGPPRAAPLLAAAGCFAAMLGAEVWKYACLLRTAGHPAPLRTGFSCAVLGKYFDNITPAGAGGQPFQMHYLKTHGCSDGVSGALPVLGFLGLQFSFILLALAASLFGRGALAGMPYLRAASRLGLCVYAVVPVCIVLFSAAPGALTRLIRGTALLLARLHAVKDADAAAERALSALGAYRESLAFFQGRPLALFTAAASSLVFRVAMLSMPFFVLCAFGAQVRFWTCFCQVACIYAAITLIPTPGNSGAAEASFYTVFSLLSPGAVFWAMLVWRLLSYYVWLLGGAVWYAARALRRRKPPRAPVETRTVSAVYFLDTYFPHIDGVVETVHAYAARLPGSHVLCPSAKGSDDGALPYGVTRVPALPLPGLRYPVPLPFLSRRAARLLKEPGFSVFHAHSPFTMGHFALRMGKRLGVPVVATFHSKYYDDVLALCRRKWLAKAVTRYIVRFYQHADEVWACSAMTAETLRAYGYRGDIRVMENGTDAAMSALPEAARQEAVRRFGLPSDRPILLFVGQQVWQKNLRLVLDTCTQLKTHGFPFHMVVAGCGGDARAIRQYAAQCRLSGQVDFIGRVCDRTALYGLYLAADLLFFPSVYDNAPLVVREAAALGLPSLLARGSNAAECVRDGWNGFTEECDSGKMAKKIIRVLRDGRTRTVGLTAQRTIPVPWDEVMAQVTDAYAVVCRSAGDAPLRP